MNKEMREKVEWLLKFRDDQRRLSNNVSRKPEQDCLLIGPHVYGSPSPAKTGDAQNLFSLLGRGS